MDCVPSFPLPGPHSEAKRYNNSKRMRGTPADVEGPRAPSRKGKTVKQTQAKCQTFALREDKLQTRRKRLQITYLMQDWDLEWIRSSQNSTVPFPQLLPRCSVLLGKRRPPWGEARTSRPPQVACDPELACINLALSLHVSVGCSVTKQRTRSDEGTRAPTGIGSDLRKI